ncbi:hypothetical protein, partial [Ligilactobacillus salivarius]|uniref:hypothetical protein n=1 Tax=Ligilactobacillus salivarius TaxID=1624 RepID=UPI0019575876
LDWRCGPSLLFCRKNGENKRRTVMQKNFTLSVLNIIQPKSDTKCLDNSKFGIGYFLYYASFK